VVSCIYFLSVSRSKGLAAIGSDVSDGR
jgi:hypothetical protein